METTAVAKSLKNACGLFLKDLQALPEDAFDKSFGPKVRTVADIVYETNLVNDHAGLTIRGEEPFKWPVEQWIKAPAGFSGKETVVQAFKESSERIVATAESYTDEGLQETIDDREGGTTNRAERCRFMTLHLWYHLGQLNFIQTLLGDDVWHW